MIDIEKAKLEFDNYTKKYDMEDEAINRKYYHTYRVMDISGEIAKSLNLSEKDVELAKLIGLLHDIARFEQYKKFQTFSDLKSIDHGDFGVEILKKDSFIRKFVETNQYDNIILKAVKNHNKYKLEEGLSEREAFFAKILRDADKIDIICSQNELSGVFILNPTYIKPFQEKRLFKNSGVTGQYEVLLRQIAFVYDMNFKYTYRLLLANDIIDKKIDLLISHCSNIGILEYIKKTVIEYMEERLKEL